MDALPKPSTEFAAAPFFLLRTPLLPFEDLAYLASDLRCAREPAGNLPLESFFEADLAQARTRLKEVLARPEVEEAIFLACPSFKDLLETWSSDPNSTKGVRAEVTLVRYFSRMAGRATPFGLLAGVSHGQIGSRTHLRLAGRNTKDIHASVSNM